MHGASSYNTLRPDDAKAVYLTRNTFSPDSPDEEITLLKPQSATARSAMTAVLPVNHWRNENDFLEAVPAKRPYRYVSTDGLTFIPAGEDLVTGGLYYSVGMFQCGPSHGRCFPIPPIYAVELQGAGTGSTAFVYKVSVVALLSPTDRVLAKSRSFPASAPARGLIVLPP
jgi:hypothetical protein